MIKTADMKKLVIGIFLLCMILISQNTVFAAQTLTLNYDGKTEKYSGITYSITIDNKAVKSDFPGIDFNKVTMFPVRAVFEYLGGTVTWNSKTQIMDVSYDGNKLRFTNNSSTANINGKSIKLTAPAKKINDRLIIPVDFLKNLKDITAVTDSKAKVIKISTNPMGSVKEVSSTTSGTKTIVTLKMNKQKGYSAYRMTSPNSIVVDFKNVKVDASQNIKTNSPLIDGINVSAIDANSARITINLKSLDNFSVEAITDGCKITIEKPIDAKLSYENRYDRVYFSLKGIKLAEVGSTIKKYYTQEYDEKTFKYTLTIPASSSVSLAEEDFNVNDSRVDNFQIFRDEKTKDTKIVINAKQEFTYYVSYNETRKQSEINLLTPAAEDEMLVVIDAGHGGEDPGAVKGNAKEKDLNLAMALKLEKLLKEKNIKTFMLRQDDTFVGLYDRPYIANALNATMFICIHNNYIDSTSVSGTETLYYPEKNGDPSFTGEKLAKMVQDSLISKLKTVNRKTVERPGLVVLKYTKMPAILAEIGFLSNAKELKNLQDSAFQQKTAEALEEAIIKGLEKISAEKKIKQPEEEQKDEVIVLDDIGDPVEAQ